MKDVSIIIVNTNNKKLLDPCLASIQKNTLNASFEIIVADNGSTDGSQSMVKEKYPEVKLIENTENMGFIKASNQGLKIFDARYAMLLNDDTIVKEYAIDKLVGFLDHNPQAGAVGPKLLNTDGSIQRQGGLIGRRFWRSKHAVEVDFVIGAALMVRREVIDKVGVMDEHLYFYNDDLDWCRSMREAGWKIYFLPEAEIVHYGGYSSKRTFNRRLFVEGFKGGLYFCRKHYGELAFHVYRLLLGLILILVLPFQLLNFDKLRAYLEIIAYAWRGQTPKPVIK
jgi:GT2 family glycosyltransferase